MMSELSKLIAKVGKEYAPADPRDFARLVAKEAPQGQLRKLLEEAVIDDCRHRLMSQRNSHIVRRTNASAKLERQRDWYAQTIATSVHVGNGKWKQFGDLTIKDLKFCIEERRNDIARIEGYISQYEKVEAAMLEHHVRKVRNLPEEVLKDALDA